MTEPYYQDDAVTLHHGHALDVAAAMAPGSVSCVVTSPPYFGLRDYGETEQYGLEKSPAEYVENMRSLFAEVRRVLSDDGTLWLNVGDSYSSRTKGTGGSGANSTLGLRADGTMSLSPAGVLRAVARQQHRPTQIETDLPDKNLIGIPWRVAFALQDDGWILRNAICWNKPNAMPESVTDRLSARHELIFMFSKSRRYWFDLDAIREPLAFPEALDGTRVFGGKNKASELTTGSSARRTGNRYGASRSGGNREQGSDHESTDPRGRNPGDVWTIPTQPFPGAHFAVFPLEIPRRCISAGCKPDGTVLDPFSGSGTTGLAASQLGRRYVGIDLSSKYLEMSLRTRLAQTALLDGGAA